MELYNKLEEAEIELAAYFGLAVLLYKVEDHTGVLWELDSNEINCYETENDKFTYVENTKKVYRGEEYTLIVIDSSFGNRYYALMDNEKEIKN